MGCIRIPGGLIQEYFEDADVLPSIVAAAEDHGFKMATLGNYIFYFEDDVPELKKVISAHGDMLLLKHQLGL